MKNNVVYSHYEIFVNKDMKFNFDEVVSHSLIS